jgi:phage portal protein BeeE
MKIFGIELNPNRRPAEGRDLPQSQIVQRAAPAYSAQDWLQGKDLDRPILTNAYQQSAWVYRAVNVLAEQVANVPFLFSSGDRGRENLITKGPLVDFYNRPHPHLNRFQYWELRVIWLMLRGECFRVPIYEDSSSGAGESFSSSSSSSSSNSGLSDSAAASLQPSRGQTDSTVHRFNNSTSGGPRRRLKAIVMLDPAHFHHIIRDHELVGWRYTGFGPQTPLAAQIFLPEEVWFERLPNPFDFWRGLPPLYAAAMAAHTDFAASLFMRGIIENNFDTGLIVRTEKALQDEQREQLLGYLRDRKRGAGVADRPLLLSGVTEIIKPELSSTDLQFLENREFSRGEICAAFGVPEEIVTATDHAKYDVMQGARLNFIENRVAPLCHRLEAEEEAPVKAFDPGAVGWFDLDSLPIMQQAQRNRLVTARAAFEMGVPFNELNRVFDLGFKRLPWGDKGYVASAMQPVGEGVGSPSAGNDHSNSNKAALPKISEAAGPDPVARALDWCEGAGTRTHTSSDAGSPAAEGAPQPAVQTTAVRQPMPEFGKSSPAVAGKLRRFLFEQRGRVLQKLASLRLTNVPTLEHLSGMEVKPQSEPDLMDVAAENARLAALLQSLGLDPQSAPIMNQRSFGRLSDVMRESVANQETFDQLTARIRALYNSITLF